MKTRSLKSIFTLTLVAGLGLQWPLHGAHFYFPVGITYAQGLQDTADKLEDLYHAANYSFDKNVVIPVGLTLNPYYEFDNGLGIGLSVGPASVIVIDQVTFNGSFTSSDTHVSYIVPVGADLRYTLFRDKNVSPYVRGGVRYPIVGGPNLDSSDVGPFGAIGIEFWHTKPVGMGIEAGYDASRITLKGPIGNTRKVTFAGFNASLFVRF